MNCQITNVALLDQLVWWVGFWFLVWKAATGLMKWGNKT